MVSRQIQTPDFWRSFAPGLHIEDRSIYENVVPFTLGPRKQSELAGLVRDEGYFQTTVDWGLDVKLMADTVRSLAAASLSPVFAFLYDEFWCPFLKLHALYASLLGEKYFLLPDFWVWNVDPKKGEAGWRPHRDKGRESLFDDGSPKSLSTWIPLSPATTLNGCMYIVPALHDPTYGTADEDEWKFEYPNIRALPGNPGDLFVWNQAVLHWGSCSSPRAPESRVSISFEFQRADVPAFNQPLIEPCTIMTFEMRLKLIAKQILQFQHMYRLEPDVARFASELLAA